MNLFTVSSCIVAVEKLPTPATARASLVEPSLILDIGRSTIDTIVVGEVILYGRICDCPNRSSLIKEITTSLTYNSDTLRDVFEK